MYCTSIGLTHFYSYDGHFRWLWPRHAFRALLLQPFISSGLPNVEPFFHSPPRPFIFLGQRCLGDSDKVCPVCERTNRKVKNPIACIFLHTERAVHVSHQVFEMKKSLEIPGDLHEQFFRYRAMQTNFKLCQHLSCRYLKGSSDGFKTVSDFFGRGVFTPH